MRKLSSHRAKGKGPRKKSVSGDVSNVRAKRPAPAGASPDQGPHLERLRAQWNADAAPFVPATFTPSAAPFTPTVEPAAGDVGASAKAEVRARRPKSIEVPIVGLKTASEQNLREHWTATYRRSAHQKKMVLLVLGATPARGMAKDGALSVTLTRISPGPGLDSDNMVSSQKHVRDAVATVIGIDDGDPRVQWYVQQRKGPWAVEIRIEARDG